jgi:ATP/maltotriose-dependent transcriptional regulator MalT
MLSQILSICEAICRRAKNPMSTFEIDDTRAEGVSRRPLLTTKFFIPRGRQNLVLRPRLIGRLDESLERTLTLISAPAGFGKTTLIVAWARTLAAPVAWLSLDEADNDPARFLSYLLGALQRVDPALGQDVRAVLETSVLARLSGPLCEALTGRADSEGVLQHLYAANVFVIPLDD